MIIDTSAIVAICKSESVADVLLAKIEAATTPLKMSTGTYLECCLVLSKAVSPTIISRFDDLLESLEVELVEFCPAQAKLAAEGHLRFGRGSGSSAKLNFGDMFAYALSVHTEMPLLFTGNDFSETDVRLA